MNMSTSATSPAIARPSNAAPNTAVNTRAGRPVPARDSVTSRPMPPRNPVEISETTTPMTAPAAAQLERRHDVGHGRREAQLEQRARHGDARLSISSSAAGVGDCRPRSVPTAMGKNVRNAPSTLAP
jgi:hypothetical protein